MAENDNGTENNVALSGTTSSCEKSDNDLLRNAESIADCLTGITNVADSETSTPTRDLEIMQSNASSEAATTIGDPEVSHQILGSEISQPILHNDESQAIASSHISKLISNAQASQPIADSEVSHLIVDSKVSKPISVSDISQPFAVQPVSNADVSKSAEDSEISQPITDSEISQPAVDSEISQPISHNDKSQSIAGSHISKLISNAEASQPIADSEVSQLIVDSKVSKPISVSDISQPVSNADVSQPVEDSEISQPITDSEISQPAVDPEFSQSAANSKILQPPSDAEVSQPIVDPEILQPILNTEVIEIIADSEILQCSGNSVSQPGAETEIQPILNKEDLQPKTYSDISQPNANSQVSTTIVYSEISTPVMSSSIVANVSDACQIDIKAKDCFMEKEPNDDANHLIADKERDQITQQCSQTNESKCSDINFTEEGINYSYKLHHNDNETLGHKTYVNICEPENFDSSDTSALMKLAELACETKKSITSNDISVFDRFESSKIYPSENEDGYNVEDDIEIVKNNDCVEPNKNYIKDIITEENEDQALHDEVETSKSMLITDTLSSSSEDKTVNDSDQLNRNEVVDNEYKTDFNDGTESILKDAETENLKENSAHIETCFVAKNKHYESISDAIRNAVVQENNSNINLNADVIENNSNINLSSCCNTTTQTVDTMLGSKVDSENITSDSVSEDDKQDNSEQRHNNENNTDNISNSSKLFSEEQNENTNDIMQCKKVDGTVTDIRGTEETKEDDVQEKRKNLRLEKESNTADAQNKNSEIDLDINDEVSLNTSIISDKTIADAPSLYSEQSTEQLDLQRNYQNSNTSKTSVDSSVEMNTFEKEETLDKNNKLNTSEAIPVDCDSFINHRKDREGSNKELLPSVCSTIDGIDGNIAEESRSSELSARAGATTCAPEGKEPTTSSTDLGIEPEITRNVIESASSPDDILVIHDSNSCRNEKRKTNEENSNNDSPKIFVRKDLEESSTVTLNTDNAISEEQVDLSKAIKISHVRSLSRPSGERNKRLLTNKEFTSSKRIRTSVVDTVSEDSSGDEERLIIDEGGSLIKNKKMKPKQDLPQQQIHKELNSEFELENGSVCNKAKSGIEVDSSNNINQSNSSSMAGGVKSAVEIVDLVDADSEISNKNTDESISTSNVNESTDISENSKCYVCDKCQDIWTDHTLKLLFEGSESVTVNSRVTYGAIICMNIYVSIHYPNIKEQALIGLLDRADLAKNLGSIKVSVLNSWLVALIKSKNIKCCDPFRPVYRMKPQNKSCISDKNKKSDIDKSTELKNSSSENQTKTTSSSRHSAISEIVIDDSENIDYFQSSTASTSRTATTTQPNKEYIKKTENFTSQPTKEYTKKADVSKNLSSVAETKGGLTFGKIITTKHFAKCYPLSYSIIQNEREYLSSDLLPFYDQIPYEPKLMEEEAEIGKKRSLTNREVLSLHSIFILNAKEIRLDLYLKFLFQLLYYRECILLIPDGKMLVKLIENVRRENNKLKFNVRNKNFLSQPWDPEFLYTAPLIENSKNVKESQPSVRDILGTYCQWKNSKLLNTDKPVLREEVLKLFGNKIEIEDCFGLCVRLFSNYCRFSEQEEREIKLKLFLNLHYLPMRYMTEMSNVATFPADMFLPPVSGNLNDSLIYLENQIKNKESRTKRSHPDSLIDEKLQQIKKLRSNLMNHVVKSSKAASLLETYARLSNELSYLEDGSDKNEDFQDSQTVFAEAFASYAPEVKIMAAKLRAANVDTENIPAILENLFHNVFKRRVPVSTII